MWPALIPLLGGLMDKLFPDPTAAAAAKLEVMKMAQTGELAQLDAELRMATGQMDINKVEAANPSLLVSGWRPAIGWICGAGCAWNWVGLPVASFTLAAIGQPVDIAPADLGEMMPLLFGLLGLGGLRSLEKIKGVART